MGTEKAALPPRAADVLRSMLRVSQMRGAQSGGGAVQIELGGCARQAIGKLVNTKRGDLGRQLSARLARTARGRAAFGGSFLAQCHVRYATSGLTTRAEAHPFRFVELGDRGMRRVHGAGSAEPSLRPIETALTHNGDMDGLRFRGVLLPFPELGAFLERVLGVENRWVGDSPQLAAALELYATRGLWLESLRLAFQLTVAGPPPDVRALEPGLAANARRGAAQALFAGHDAPPLATLRAWEVRVEEAIRRAPRSPGDTAGARDERKGLLALLVASFAERPEPELPAERLAAFIRAAIDAFFDNDLYVAVRKLEPGLEGTFGCVVTSTLEPGCFVALSRGQPLSLGFRRETALVCAVSERAAVKVCDESGAPAFHERLDLDLCRGEIARVAIADDGRIELTLYGVVDGRERGSKELVAEGRLVPLRDNPYVAPLGPDTGERTAADLAAIPALTAAVRRAFREPGSPNARTGRAFAERLLQSPAPRLLVLGITNDLWLAEQFVRNLKALFPHVVAEAKSSNAVLLDGAPELAPDTVLLAVSQSGQDFPTLGAFVLLMQRCRAGSAFVLSGEVDSLLGHAAGQSYASNAPFGERIFSNLSGFRPSEAALATVSASHQTFVEILLVLSAHALDARRFASPPHGLALTPPELLALERRRDAAIDQQVPSLTAPGAAEIRGAPARELARQARRWKQHVLEWALAFLAVVLVLEANLVLHLGILPSRLLEWISRSVPHEAATVLGAFGAQADVAFYALLAPLVVWGMRAAQGRPLFHRQGARELLVGDTEYVHRILWLLSRKLFSLSYGFASLKPYSANCHDELVLTHEPVRGTLALFGLPDARHEALRSRSQAALMSVKQFAFSRSLRGAGAEIVTLSHGSRSGGAALGTHIALPDAPLTVSTPLTERLAEGMFDSWERLVAMQVLLEELARGVSRAPFFGFDRSRTKDQVFAPTTAAPVSAAHIYQLLARSAERYEGRAEAALPFDVVHTEWRPTAPRARTTVWRA